MGDHESENGGLNEQEVEIMGLLVKAWNLWCDDHKDAGETTGTFRQFRDGILQCQRMLGWRVLNRECPGYWKL